MNFGNPIQKKFFFFINIILAASLCLVVLAQGGHDLWSSTLVQLILTIGLLLFLAQTISSFTDQGILEKQIFWSLLPIFTCIPSYLYATNSFESFWALRDWISAVIVFILASHSFREIKNPKVWTSIIIPIFLVEVVMQIVQRGTATGWNFLWIESKGTLVNANVSAGFHLLWLPVLDSFYKQGKSTGDLVLKKFSLLAMILCVLSLILSSSVTAILAIALYFFVGCDLDEFIGVWKKNPKRILGMSIGLFILFFGMTAFKIQESYFPTTEVQRIYSTSRVEWWKSALLMWKEFPWTGIGLGNFPSAYLTFKVGDGQNSLYPHSFILGLLSETGLIGFLGFFLFFVHWLLTICRERLEKEKWPFIFGVLLFLFFGSINLSLEYLSNKLVVAFFMGIVIASSNEPRKKWRGSVALVLSFFVIAAIPYVVSPFMASQRVEGAKEILKSVQIDSIDLSKVDESEKLFSSALDLDPKNFEIYQGLAQVCFFRFLLTKDSQYLSQAISRQQEAINYNRMSGELWWELGTFFKVAGDSSSEKYAFEQAVMHYKRNTAFRKSLEELNAS